MGVSETSWKITSQKAEETQRIWCTVHHSKVEELVEELQAKGLVSLPSHNQHRGLVMIAVVSGKQAFEREFPDVSLTPSLQR